MRNLILAYILFLAGSAQASSLEKTELQWVLCEPSVDSFASKIQLELPGSDARDVYYLETPGLELIARNAIVRIRQNGTKIKSSAKVNYRDDVNLPWGTLKGVDSKCEWDRYPGYKKVGCSITNKATDLSDSLSEEQEDFLREETGFSDFKSLQRLGPAQSEEWVWQQNDLSLDFSLEKVVASQFFSLELSVRVLTRDADATEQKVNHWLQQTKVVLCPLQRGKTEDLLRRLSK